jgi:hypothetical protein
VSDAFFNCKPRRSTEWPKLTDNGSSLAQISRSNRKLIPEGGSGSVRSDNHHPATMTWKPYHAWLLPLRHDPWERKPADQFVQILKQHANDTIQSRWQRMAALVLLFRCYYEGFGTSQNCGIAGAFLRDAAQLGDGKAQSILQVYHEAAGLAIPRDTDVRELLCLARLQGHTRLAMADKLKPCKLCSNLADDMITAVQAGSYLLSTGICPIERHRERRSQFHLRRTRATGYTIA